MSGSDRMQQIESSLFKKFPLVKGKDSVMLYGSHATGHEGAEKSLFDMVFIVEDIKRFHIENLQRNPDHYSFFAKRDWKRKGIDPIMEKQHAAAGIYYHPDVPLVLEDGSSVHIKYGIIALADVLQDLQERDDVYIAGRMHKDVVLLSGVSELLDTMDTNLMSAVIVALLLLPETFSLEKLYETIVGLSYMGDLRGKLSVDTGQPKINKLLYTKEHPTVEEKNIGLQRYNQKYQKMLDTIIDMGILQHLDDLTYMQVGYTDPTIFQCLIDVLPIEIRNDLFFFDAYTKFSRDSIQNTIPLILRAIIASSSKGQTSKGIYSAGIQKSLQYAFAKIHKMIQQKNRSLKKNVI